MQKIYAHRGASGYAPENTLRAFALAADMGADGVELDVQISKDGRLVVFHDDELSRLTGFTGSVADYPYAELCQMPVIHAVDATERDVAPLLEDVLALLRERGYEDIIGKLRNLGADDRTIVRIFSFEGRLISFIGVVAGTVLGLLLCLAQQHFGLLKMGDEAGSFIVDAYPVSVHAWDIVVIFVTVLVAGHLSTWYPVRYLSKRLL